MKMGKAVILTIAIVAFLTTISFAADRYVRLRSVEGDVSIYPSDGQRPTDATVNTPLMDRDEIQTQDGRAELSFRNGITVRIGDYSSVRLESTYSPMTIQLLQGTVFLDSHLIDRFRDELVLRAGDAEVYLLDEGNIRVDLGDEGAIRVTTIEGQAEVKANGQRVLVNSGERTYIDPGREPEEPETFRGSTDELDEWNESRMEYYADGDLGGGNYDDYVDEDIYYDSYDLGGYGDWRNSGSYGYVWVPHVDYGWRPYYDGRWSYGNAGWFWISNEPWGWAPYHYGRWGWSLDFGWYWIPGNVFAPSWVSWYSYGDYIGWCPLNYYNYPIYYHNYYNYHNNYYRYPSIQKQKTLDASNSWTFVKKNDLGLSNVKKAVLDASSVRNIRIEKEKLSSSPRKELVSYVIPKTPAVKGFVNDKRVIKELRRDIESPLGIKHREEQFERGSKGDKGPTIRNNKGRGDERAVEKLKDPARIQPPKPSSKPKEDKPNQDWNRGKSSNRDFQFQRNQTTKKHYTPYLNPYYKDKNRSNDRDFGSSQSKISPWSRKPETYQRSYERQKEVNPRYRDEAKKYFERFDHKNRGETHNSAPRSYAPTSPRNYEPPTQRNYNSPSPRNYEAPRREYKAPETKRPDYSNRSRQSDRYKPSGNSNRNNNSNHNNNKKQKP
ncbi:FecR domain-containing protein [bacterium]|nr:FecR domain-containing protein [bacterium]